ncbi:MAG: translation elongation factor Ts [Saprospiraceae bacterium]|nr:translation elongation factor Ts [Saprospiraceae bacterium]
MTITAADVNKLRKLTGAGMMDCKKALVEAGGDIEAAIDYLRKKGQKIAAKRADRETNEGVVIAETLPESGKGLLVSVSCETDFVAKNDDFKNFAKSIAGVAKANFPSAKEGLLGLTLGDNTVAEALVEQTGKIGEKIDLSNYEVMEGEKIASYIHAGSKIGVLVNYKDGGKEGGEAFFKGVAMHIAAMKPTILSYTEFDPEFIAKETEAFRNQIITENEERTRLGKHLKNVPDYVSKVQLTPEVMAQVEEKIKAELKAEGKPEHIWDKILPGKLERYVADNTLLDQEHCLLDQFYALDGDKTVAAALKDFHNDAEVVSFKRVAI